VTIAIYPGTFDPITNGHLDVTTRASKLFQKLIVGVYATPSKETMFSTEERVNLVKEAIVGLPNVEVQTFKGLTVDFARNVGAQAIVRGLRAGADFEWEFEMALMNKKLAPECDVVCLMANLKYQFVSSSLLKEVAKFGGDTDDLVPKAVALALKDRVHSSKS
jgi:pantetheine-phosphate adenylyltransferase